MSSIFIDFRTLSFVLVLFSALFTFIMFFIGRTHKTHPGFGLWTVSNLLIAVGFFLIGFRGIWPDFVTMTIGNVFSINGLLVAFEGNKRFLKFDKYKFLSPGLIALQALGFTYLSLINNPPTIRIIFVSLIPMIITGFSAFLFIWASTAKKVSFSHKFTSVTYLVFSLLMIIRSIITCVFSGDHDSHTLDWIQSVVFLILIVFVTIWTFNYMLLNSERVEQKLKSTQVELEKLATTDFLTGINNKRQFFEISKNEINRARRYHTPLSLIMLDIDFFKQINDSYGHAGGDQVLADIVNVCRKTVRNVDVLARLGGEEFAILLPHTSIDNAGIVAEYLRSAIEDSNIEFSPKTIKVTASFGISALSAADNRIETILERADTALYKAKRMGRNRVVAEVPNLTTTKSL